MIDFNLILNFLIAIFFYNIILKAIGAAFMKQFMKNDTLKKEKKSFQERVREKLEDQNPAKK